MVIFLQCSSVCRSLSLTSCSETVSVKPGSYTLKFRDDFEKGKLVWASVPAAPGSGPVQRHDSVRALMLELWIQEVQLHHPVG